MNDAAEGYAEMSLSKSLLYNPAFVRLDAVTRAVARGLNAFGTNTTSLLGSTTITKAAALVPLARVQILRALRTLLITIGKFPLRWLQNLYY
jgi:hypothetical protein